MEDKALLDAATVEAGKLEDLDRSDLDKRLQDLGVLVIRGLISATEIQKVKQKMRELFSMDDDHAGTGESPGQLYENYQKFSVNGGEFRDNAHPQCVRSFYNPTFAPDVFGMRKAFQVTARVRNILMGVDVDWAINAIDDGFWTAARIHHYPRGGGFMSAHCEDYVPQFYKEANLENAYFQPLIAMSKKGPGPDCDYETGGGYFIHEERKCYYEQHVNIGDILIYDTRVIHGVTEIDAAERFRQSELIGRFAGFVTLYKDLT